MAKKRVHEIAKAQGLSSKELLAALKKAGIEAKAAASSVEEADALKALSGAEERRRRYRDQAEAEAQTKARSRRRAAKPPPKPAGGRARNPPGRRRNAAW